MENRFRDAVAIVITSRYGWSLAMNESDLLRQVQRAHELGRRVHVFRQIETSDVDEESQRKVGYPS